MARATRPATMPEPAQPSSPRAPRLRPDSVHIWTVRLDLPQNEVESLRDALVENERARADRFRTDALRARFITSRAAQRQILARYGAASPGAITFRYSTQGKPSLESPVSLAHLRFNVSHSADLALLAVAENREVGIDVEAVRVVRDATGLARRFFSPAECAALQMLTGDRLTRAFLACWTRKEAYVKAIGLGIATQLGNFDVTVDPDSPATIEATRPDAGDAARWTMHSVDAGPGYFATLVVEGGPASIAEFEWKPDR